MNIPAGYTKVEYLESRYNSDTDHPYIEIPSLGKDPAKFKSGRYLMKMRRLDSGEIRMMGFGNNTSFVDSGQSCWNVVGGNTSAMHVAFNYGGSWHDDDDPSKNFIGTDIEVDYSFKEGEQKYSLNGKTYSASLSFAFTKTCTGFYLFRVNDSMKNNHGQIRLRGSMRIYWAQVYDGDGNLAADVVPVKENSSGKGCMYDSVSGQILEAQCGTFQVGPDVLCKFKDPGNGRLCRLVYGECQFLENGYQDGHACSILENYKDREID